MLERKRSRAKRYSECKGTPTKALPCALPYAHTAAGYHQRAWPDAALYQHSGDNNRNPPAQRRTTTLNARKRRAHDDAAATTISCVGGAYRV